MNLSTASSIAGNFYWKSRHGLAAARETLKVCDKFVDGVINRGKFLLEVAHGLAAARETLKVRNEFVDGVINRGISDECG